MSDNLSSNINQTTTEKKILTKTSEYKEKLQKTLSLPTIDTPQTTHNLRKVNTKT
tara:strand:+ start:80 stop:244 length:165 start_codon:yes stop_codon:yes gene_type:complete